MRVTSNMTSNNSIYNLQQARARMDKTEEKIYTEQNINRPSDNPVADSFLLDIADKLKTGEQYLNNIKKATMWQQMTDTALTGMDDTIALARQFVNPLTSGTTDLAAQQNAISQLQILKQQMIDIGNTQIGDQYLFGGAKNSTPPFTNVVSPPALSTDYYTGDETALQVEIGAGSKQDINVLGNKLLTGANLPLPAPAGSLPYGTTNILKTFDDLIAAIGATDISAIQAGAQALVDGAKQINNAKIDVASRIARLDSSTKMNENNKNTLNNIMGSIQNIDYAQLGVELNQQKTAFEASLSTSAKVSQMSLLDYL